MNFKTFFFFLVSTTVIQDADGVICQTGCNGLAVSCYAAAGFIFGTVTAGVGIPVAITGCNLSLGTCMAACIAAGFAPTL